MRSWRSSAPPGVEIHSRRSASRTAAIEPPRRRATDNPRGDVAVPRSKSVFETQVDFAWLRRLELNGD